MRRVSTSDGERGSIVVATGQLLKLVFRNQSGAQNAVVPSFTSLLGKGRVNKMRGPTLAYGIYIYLFISNSIIPKKQKFDESIISYFLLLYYSRKASYKIDLSFFFFYNELIIPHNMNMKMIRIKKHPISNCGYFDTEIISINMCINCALIL